jgi:hypothetical protein
MFHCIRAISNSWHTTCSKIYMKHKPKIQNIVRTLIKSRFYFDLSLRERLDFIKEIVQNPSVSLRRPIFLREKDLVLRSER